MIATYSRARAEVKPRHNRAFSDEELARELWRTCPSYPTWEASSLGRIRSRKTKHVQRIQVTNRGYGVLDNGKTAVHHLVADAFFPGWSYAKANGLEIDHIDGDPANNAPENLQMLTHKANCARSFGRPLLVGDTVYPSVAEAARSLNRGKATIYQYIHDGRTSQPLGSMPVEYADDLRDDEGATYSIQ